MSVNNNAQPMSSNAQVGPDIRGAIKLLADQLLCPSEKTYMCRPVQLIPCNHHISDVAWNALKNGRASYNCPVCRKAIEKGIPDPRLISFALSVITKLDSERAKDIQRDIVEDDYWNPYINVNPANIADNAHPLVISEILMSLMQHAQEIPAENVKKGMLEVNKFKDVMEWVKKREAEASKNLKDLDKRTTPFKNLLCFYAYCLGVQKGIITQFPGRDDWGEFALASDTLLNSDCFKTVVYRACTLYMIDLLIYWKETKQSREALAKIDVDFFFQGEFKQHCLDLIGSNTIKSAEDLRDLYMTDGVQATARFVENLKQIKAGLEKKWSQIPGSSNTHAFNGKEEIKDSQSNSNSNSSQTSPTMLLMFVSQMINSQSQFMHTTLSQQDFFNAYNQLGNNCLGFDGSMIKHKMWHFAYCTAVQEKRISRDVGRDDWGQVAIENESQLPQNQRLGNLKRKVVIRAATSFFLSFCIHLLNNNQNGVLQELKSRRLLSLHADTNLSLAESRENIDAMLVSVIIREYLPQTNEDSFTALTNYICSNASKENKVAALQNILNACQEMWTQIS